MSTPSYQQQVFQLVKELTQEGAVIAVPKLFVRALGSLDAAYFLSQLLYWSDKGKRADGFFYKTDNDWHEELGLTTYKVRKARKQLEDLGLVETKVKRANGSPTVHYKIDKEGISNWILQFSQEPTCENSQMENAKTDKSLTENTAENTALEKSSGADAPTNGPIIEKTVQPTPVPGHRDYFAAVQEALRLPPKLTKNQAGRCARLAKQVRESDFPIEVVEKAGRYWWTEDWRGMKGDPPRDEDLTHRMSIIQRSQDTVRQKWRRV